MFSKIYCVFWSLTQALVELLWPDCPLAEADLAVIRTTMVQYGKAEVSHRTVYDVMLHTQDVVVKASLDHYGWFVLRFREGGPEIPPELLPA